MTTSQSGTDANLTFIEYDQAQTPAAGPTTSEPSRVSYRLPGCLSRFVTEFIVTEDWYLVFTSPLSLNFERLATLYMVSCCVLVMSYH